VFIFHLEFMCGLFFLPVLLCSVLPAFAEVDLKEELRVIPRLCFHVCCCSIYVCMAVAVVTLLFDQNLLMFMFPYVSFILLLNPLFLHVFF